MVATDKDKMSQEEFDELQKHIEAWVNNALEEAIKDLEKEQK